MKRPDGSLHSALATLQGRWGSAAIRLGSGDPVPLGPAPRTEGALALAPVPPVVPLTEGAPPGPRLLSHAADPPSPRHVPDEALPGSLPAPTLLPGGGDRDPGPSSPSPDLRPGPASPEVVSTGFPALDAILGPAGLPREASAAIRGDLSSGKTTLALHCVAEAQAAGAIVAWLDLGRTFDPHEALGRGVDLRWLLVVRPADAAEALALAGALLAGRAVDLLVVDLPGRAPERWDGALRRLVAHARRTRSRILVLEPVSIGPSLHAELAEATGLRLELERRAWLRLGRDVVGQRTEVTVARNRYGPPGRRAALEILYLPDGERAVEASRHALHQLGTEEPGARARVAHGGSVPRAAAGPA